ncbi:hypothetical protein [Nocardia xishanensis]|uniref:hypothetical protein n=1 Tax=Nocardia xishanensis TaxID=238964 RepID=UPI000836D7D8|nr:hypothetical protein [Nocardia xishanensis]
MSMPNPDEHGEELGGAQTPREQAILAALDADMEGSTADKLAAQLVPVIPDGGLIGRTAAPHVGRVTKARDWARIWGPAMTTTGGTAVAVAVLPLPGPLALYVLALAAFAWWHCAGRPGPAATVQTALYAAADFGAWVRRNVERLAVRRAAAENRRTAINPK